MCRERIPSLYYLCLLRISSIEDRSIGYHHMPWTGMTLGEINRFGVVEISIMN